MKQAQLTVDFKVGIHSRPAALLVKKVREYPVKITFSHNGKSCSGNSLIGLLSLGIGKGSQITLTVEGENEDQILPELIEFFNQTVAAEE